MSHIRTSHATQCHTYEWVMSHIWMSHVTQFHINEWVMLHIWMSHVAHVNESCRTYLIGVFHYLICTCEWVTSHIRTSHATQCHTYEWVMSRNFICMNESCHTYECAMSHVRMGHVTRMNESGHISKWVMSHIWLSHVTHTIELSNTYECSVFSRVIYKLAELN